MKYAAIDFETASSSPASACSVGIVRMDEEGAVLDRYYSLIRPASSDFSPSCFAIHRLDPVDILIVKLVGHLLPDMVENIFPFHSRPVVEFT